MKKIDIEQFMKEGAPMITIPLAEKINEMISKINELEKFQEGQWSKVGKE